VNRTLPVAVVEVVNVIEVVEVVKVVEAVNVVDEDPGPRTSRPSPRPP
jgi:hypothetical protein